MNRSYSITTDQDQCHVSNGRCPNYALSWSIINHQPHWPSNHDYFMGNGENINDGTQELREILSKRLSDGIITKHIIFCDLDGVLADFEQGIKNKFNKSIDELKPGFMWSVVNKSSTFFNTLPWMPKGRELWEQIREYHPIILTGVPKGNRNFAEQKRKWCERELGPDIQVITCYTKDKPEYCLYKSILIDDRPDNLFNWNEKGGKFILYNEEDLNDITERIHRHMETELTSP
jgi:5'(3')-deoxyribonucleotidase